MLNGVPVANAVANVAFNHDNKVVAFGNSFVKPTKVAAATPKIGKAQAIKVAEDTLDGKYNGKEIGLEYVCHCLHGSFTPKYSFISDHQFEQRSRPHLCG
jgi:Zn-dependent metalloprotease